MFPLQLRPLTVIHGYKWSIESCHHDIWLLVWNIFFDFPHIGNVIIPTDGLIFFREIETTNHYDKSIDYLYGCYLDYPPSGSLVSNQSFQRGRYTTNQISNWLLVANIPVVSHSNRRRSSTNPTQGSSWIQLTLRGTWMWHIDWMWIFWDIYLVGGFNHFSIIYRIILPIDELIFFRMVF